MRLTKNATSLAKRVPSLHALKLVLVKELDAISKAGSEALTELEALASSTEKLLPAFVAQVTLELFSCPDDELPSNFLNICKR